MELEKQLGQCDKEFVELYLVLEKQTNSTLIMLFTAKLKATTALLLPVT